MSKVIFVSLAVLLSQASALVLVNSTYNGMTEKFTVQNGGCYGAKASRPNEFSGSFRGTCRPGGLFEFFQYTTFDCSGSSTLVYVSSFPHQLGNDTTVRCDSVANSAESVVIKSFNETGCMAAKLEYTVELASGSCSDLGNGNSMKLWCASGTMTRAMYSGSMCAGNATSANSTFTSSQLPHCNNMTMESDQYSCITAVGLPTYSPSPSPTPIRAATVVEVRSTLTFNGISCADLNTPTKLSKWQQYVVAALKARLGVTDLALFVGCKKSGSLNAELVVYAADSSAATALTTSIGDSSLISNVVSDVNTAVAADPALAGLPTISGVTPSTPQVVTSPTPTVSPGYVAPSPSPTPNVAAGASTSPSPSPAEAGAAGAVVPSVILAVISIFLSTLGN